MNTAQNDFHNPIDPDKVAQNPGLLPYAHTVGSAVIKPEDKGKLKSRALAAMEQQTQKQLGQIYQQMELLAKQARDIQKRIEISNLIYDAEMGFEPFVGHVYHLYQKETGKRILSILAPEEWGNTLRYRWLAEVRLLADHTWEVERFEDDLFEQEENS